MGVGERIKQRRKELGFNADYVANKLNVSRSTIFRYEKGEIEKLPTSILEQLSNILQTTPGFLMGWEDKVEQNNILSIFNQLNLENQQDVLKYTEKKLEKQLSYEEHEIEVKLLGTTAAGSPLTYGDECCENIRVANVPKGADFALTVCGDSMEPLIKNGDIIFVHTQPDVENGQIAIIEINHCEVTCKEVRKFEDGHIEFHSINKKYAPITTNSYRIIGRVLIEK